MINSIVISADSYREPLVVKSEDKIDIDCANVLSENKNSFDIAIEFEFPIIAFRNHDYTWADVTKDRIANSLSPKLIRLQNGHIVQANIQHGFWEVRAENPKMLLWRFNPEHSQTIVEYTGSGNNKLTIAANSPIQFPESPALLFSEKNGVEISRSKKSFSAIACFTDHCDFDTLSNLQLQRNFFKEKDIKVTKGFFLNHFSKRQDNASFERDKQELDRWRNDGHELCYHSLSQSLKSDKDSIDDFETFQPPYDDLQVWIDHGYQSYNFSLFKNAGFSSEEYEAHLKKKGISVLWNYIDSGTSTSGVINQLNSNQFTVATFFKGTRGLGFVKRMSLLIKNCIFHHYAGAEIISDYKSLSTDFKKIVFQKKFKTIPKFISGFSNVFFPLVNVFLVRNHFKTYNLAKYSPVFFRHRIAHKDFFVFQTLEMVDFKKSLSKQNLDLLIKESGLFIAHTYFSVPMEYHQGKMFAFPEQIDQEVDENFEYLSQRVKENLVWNPTLSELLEYLANFEATVFDVDKDGRIFCKNNFELNNRSVY